MKKKLISVLLSAAMATTMLAGCGSTAADTGAAPAETKATEEKTEAADTEAETGTEEAAATGEGKVYYLNFKPEQADDWVALAEDYTAETGVPVTVVTAASGTYESTLKSEMAKTEAPTLFQVNGPVGLASWKDYCYDLKDSECVSAIALETLSAAVAALTAKGRTVQVSQIAVSRARAVGGLHLMMAQNPIYLITGE